MSPAPLRITLTLRGEGSLSANDVWPDGDKPAIPTADDVVSMLAKHLDPLDAMSVALRVNVSAPNPAWKGDHVLFGDPPPRTINTTAEVPL